MLKMSLMRAIRFHKFGGPQVLQIDEIPKPHFENHQVLIKVKTIGINPVETYFREGVRNPNLPLPHILGCDGAGVVENIGKDVNQFQVGQRVAFYNLKSSPKHGAYAEYTVLDETEVWPLHKQLTFNQGAAVGVPYFTAYRAIVTIGKAKAGETLLVHGASGAVGIASVQLGKHLNLKVIGTAGTDEGCKFVKDQGADIVFNHNNADHFDLIKESTVPSGVNILVEMLSNVNLGKDLPLLSNGGRVLIVGSRGEVTINPRDLMAKESTIQGVMLYNLTPEEYKSTKDTILDGINNGWVKPIVGKEYPMDQVRQAHHEIIHGGGTKGKMVLNLDL